MSSAHLTSKRSHKCQDGLDDVYHLFIFSTTTFLIFKSKTLNYLNIN